MLEPEENLIEECVSGEDNYCEGNFKVYSEFTETCVEDNGWAYCHPDYEEDREDCGPDVCIPYTELDKYVQEYVEDEETCNTNGETYCGEDEAFYDFCLPDGVSLMQVSALL